MSRAHLIIPQPVFTAAPPLQTLQTLRAKYISLLIEVCAKRDPFDPKLADHIEDLIERLARPALNTEEPNA